MYEKILRNYIDIKIRKIPKQNIYLRDCIIFNFKSQSIAKFFLREISKFKIATKNILMHLNGILLNIGITFLRARN